jgi:anti-sigma regulatory factor (Ser/Thr protein kinase)
MPAPQLIPYKVVVGDITADVVAHPRDLSKVIAQRYEVTRATSANTIRRLEREGWISRSGSSTHPVFTPGFKRSRTFSRPLAGLEEDVLWEQDFAPYFTLQPNIRGIVQHGFTEMVNNAIDHSAGTQVSVSAVQNEKELDVFVWDDGIGIFRRIADALQLADLRMALFELHKGKLTTDPRRHSGEGVFFTSRMFDTFGIHANGLYFSHKEQAKNDWLVDASDGVGTVVHMTITLDTKRTTTEIFQEYMNAPDDYGFNKTVVPMKLAQIGGEQMISRSQAKRLISRFEKFKTVLLDFQSVAEIGQAFADEIFRVYATAHPDVDLVPINMTEQVERMWRRATLSDIGR